MSLSKKQGKAFWKQLDNLDTSREKINWIKSISNSNWQKYFENILSHDQPVKDSEEAGALDFQISCEEPKEASYVLKNGKSTGLDMISIEMLQCILETNPEILLNFCNSHLHHNPDILAWSTSLLTPIHKKGPKITPDNYRKISLILRVYKLFSAIFNKRLLRYCNNKNILSQEQLGFMPGNRTSDAHVLMHNLIQGHCQKKGKRYLHALLILVKPSIPFLGISFSINS